MLKRQYQYHTAPIVLDGRKIIKVKTPLQRQVLPEVPHHPEKNLTPNLQQGDDPQRVLTLESIFCFPPFNGYVVFS